MTYAALPGTVYFIGAGPGAPDLITVRGGEIIAQADLVLYADSLVEESVAQLARKPGARIAGTSDMHLEQMVALMIEAVQADQVVARVHSGDPALYGATYEQMVALERADVPYVVVPGVPSTFAAAARLGVELTVPDLVQTIILTRAAGRVAMPAGEDLRSLAAHGASLAIHLSVTRIRQVVEELLAGGSYTPDTPVAVLHRVSWPDESMVVGTLADIADRVRAAGYTRQALILVSPALDPALKQRHDPAVSRLYDKTYTHRFRRAADDQERAINDEVRMPKDSVWKAEDERPGATPAAAVVAVTRRGSELAARLSRELDADLAVPARFSAELDNRPDTSFDDSAIAEIRRRWEQHRALVLVMATGVAVRAIAPLLGRKASDPAVICLDEAGRAVIPLLGGHQAGANELARRIAVITGGAAAITTASDMQGKPALDLLGQEQGWRIDPASALTHASACLVNDEPVGVFIDPALPHLRQQAEAWLAQAGNLAPLENLDDLLSDEYAAGLIISHRVLDAAHAALLRKSVLYRPSVLVAGIGCRRGVAATELRTALDITLSDAGLAPGSLAALATVDLKADEPGLQVLAAELGVPLQIVERDQIAALDPANFSPSAAQERFDLPGVAEPCAVLVANGDLLVPKRAFERCTVAVAIERGTPNAERGAMDAPAEPTQGVIPATRNTQHASLSLISIGPGDPQQMTIAARDALRAAEVVIGYQGYVDQVRPLLAPTQEALARPMGSEFDRARQAIDLAAAGRRVALISSGDIGVYAMAGPVFEALRERGWQGSAPEVAVFPGISAFQAAAAQLGAPISHDFCIISLSDLLTPWAVIERRIQAVAQGDFVIAFYNPRSRERDWQLARAFDILRAHRPPETPVAMLRNVTRPDETTILTTLAAADPASADMFTLVLVGNSQSYVVGGRMATPRGYEEAKGRRGEEAQGLAYLLPNDALAHSPFASSDHTSSFQTYPITLTRLRGAPVVVVGGGAVGERKVGGLLAVGAAVRLISPTATAQLQAWAAEGRVQWEQRPYAPGDLEGARLAFAATDQRDANRQVAREAAQRGMLCNIADAPDEGNFHLPAVHRGPGVAIAVGTDGASPARAAALRDRIARWLSNEQQT